MKSKIKLFAVILGVLFTANELNAQVINGKVVDKNGEPISGATIAYGENKGVTSDANGLFTINREDVGSEFTVSFLGYKSQQVKVSDKKELTVTLEEDQKVLDQVVVVGYGKLKREKLTGSVTTIDEATLATYSGKSVLDVLQGRVAGLQVASKSGLPGAGASINIRGVNTIGSSFVDACGEKGCCTDPNADDQTNTEPLIIVDGVPFINQSVSALSIGAAGATGPLATLSTSDIERIDILKDADATAIYGSRGANGVILISTKRGLTGNDN